MSAGRIPFTEDDEHKIASAATWGSIVGLATIGTQLLTLLFMYTADQLSTAAMGENALQFLVVGYTLLVNIWLLQASAAFRKVARTDEADQVYLLQGFRKLRVYFMVQVLSIVIIVPIGILAVAM